MALKKWRATLWLNFQVLAIKACLKYWPVEGSSSSDRAESSSSSSSSSSKPRLDKSKTERQQKVTHILAEDAAKILDYRISAEKKLNLLNRITTVKHDGKLCLKFHRMLSHNLLL